MKTRSSVFVTVALAALFHAAAHPRRTISLASVLGTVVAASAPQQTGAAVLSVASGFATQSGTGNPLAGSPLILFKESFGGFMKRTGMFQGPPGTTVKESPLAVWASACRSGSPICKQALYEMRPFSVGEA